MVTKWDTQALERSGYLRPRPVPSNKGRVIDRGIQVWVPQNQPGSLTVREQEILKRLEGLKEVK